jgi:hypothetical protein
VNIRCIDWDVQEIDYLTLYFVMTRDLESKRLIT